MGQLGLTREDTNARIDTATHEICFILMNPLARVN